MRPYHLVSTWHLNHRIDRVWEAIEHSIEAEDPVAWWGSVRAVPGGGHELEARSIVGYRLRFRIEDLVIDRPNGLSLRTTGDLIGTAVLGLSAGQPATCRVTIDWRVTGTPGWMAASGFALRPVFVVAHWWIMRQGERRFDHWLRGHGS